MKKIISFILSICVFAMGLPSVISFADNIDYTEAENENGYLFMISDSSESIDVEKYPDITVVTSELARIYFAQDLDVIKSISDIYDIEYVEQNAPLYKPEPIYTEDEVSLYSLEDKNISLFAESMSTDESVDAPEATEIPIETTVPVVNDPLYQYQWSHEAVNVKAYWENGITGEGVKVGVIDTGINREHSAFNGVNIETGINVCAYVAKDEENLYDTTDKDGHGTAVTSIICSTINDNVGMAGLTDKVTIVPYKIHDSNYATYIDGAAFLRAIDLAYQENCDILNISQGSTTRYDIEETLINQAVQHGMIVCAAAGNRGYGDSPVEYPAGYENVIGVGGVEPDNCEKISVGKNNNTGEILGLEDDVIATFNNGYSEKYDLHLSDLVGNYQYTIDAVANIPKNSYMRWGMSTANESVFVSAPGDLLCTANHKDIDYYNTTTGGTSSATPFVVAAAAGVKQIRPRTTVNEFKEILKATSIDLDEPGYDINTGYGMIDFEAIYNYVIDMPEPPIYDISSDENIKASCVNCEYNSNTELNKIAPVITYTNPDTNEIITLEADWDYEIVGYTDYENAGTAAVTVRGIEEHGYKGTLGINYTINPADISNRNIVISFIDKQEYTGEALTPEITLVYESGDNDRLVPEVDYTVEYINNINPGTAIVKVKGIGNYATENDCLTSTFEIVDTRPTVMPTAEPTAVPSIKPVQTTEPSAEPTMKPSETSSPVSTAEPTSTVIPSANPSSEPIHEEYDIETSIAYDPESGECTYSAVNKTEQEITAVGIIAVYAQNGTLKHLEVIDAFQVGNNDKKLNFALSDGDTVKFFVWDGLSSMQPYKKAKIYEWQDNPKTDV